jgi:alkanesulfonate monooxygenase SsuD/methylene tetrahydromethanopterin reductase-like flavin-dependent oxidoreductase (luciferase family)
VKLCYFHLMPWPDLPEDFKQRHGSVWVDISPGLFDPVRANAVYNDYLDELEFAAEMGFDGICVNEHHANAYGLMPSPNLMAAALARRTRDAALVVMGNSLALYNPPTRVAEEFAMLDCISGGRLVAGFPVGTPMDTCYAYGQNPSTLRDRYHEAHDLILRAWTEPEPFAFCGRFNQQAHVNPWPRPLQRPHPPIWIPGGGSVETWRWCAEKDYVYSYLSYYGYQAGEATLRGFWDEMGKLGKDRNPFRAGFLQFVGVAESEREAQQLYAGPAAYFYQRCLHVSPRFVNPPGYMTEETIRARVESQVARAAAQAGTLTGPSRTAPTPTTFAEMVEQGWVIAGTPEHVTERLLEVARRLNVGQLMLLLQFGDMGKPLARYNTELFAKRVMPELRGLFEDEWENRWWPRPLAPGARAVPAELAR